MKRLAERDPLDHQHHSEANKRPKYDKTTSDQKNAMKSGKDCRWRVPDSHGNMPQAIRKEVREFHQISVHVSEPPKVNLLQTQLVEDSKEAQVSAEWSKYCDTTFNKEHAFKVSPPLPTFKAMTFHKDVIDCLNTKFDIQDPTSF